MANTATLVNAGPNHLCYRLNGDGTVAGPTIANATLLTDCPAGPLRDLLNAAYANQAAMRVALFEGEVMWNIQQRDQVIMTGPTGTAHDIVVDVDTDAVTPTKAEVNVRMSDTGDQVAYLTILHRHSISR